jgi:hypothetical protein
MPNGDITLDPIIIEPRPTTEGIEGDGPSFADWIDANPRTSIDHIIDAYIGDQVEYWMGVAASDVFSLVIFDAFTYLYNNHYQSFYDTLAMYSYYDNIIKTEQTAVDLLGTPFDGKYDDYNNTFSNSNFTAIRGLAHYLYGNGATMVMPINNIGLQVGPDDNFINGMSFDQIVEEQNFVGTQEFEINKFRYSVYNDSYDKGLLLGNITLRLMGDLTRNEDGSWEFDGVIRAWNDTYDFNPSDHRPEWAEMMTWAGDQFPGTPYSIEMPGQISVHWSGEWDFQ